MNSQPTNGHQQEPSDARLLGWCGLALWGGGGSPALPCDLRGEDCPACGLGEYCDRFERRCSVAFCAMMVFCLSGAAIFAALFTFVVNAPVRETVLLAPPFIACSGVACVGSLLIHRVAHGRCIVPRSERDGTPNGESA